MVTWECGSCGANFQDAFKLETHRVEAHNEHPRPGGEYTIPQSAEQKPLGEGFAPDRQDLRTGRQGDMDKKRTERERLEEEVPKSEPGVKQANRPSGPVGHKKE